MNMIAKAKTTWQEDKIGNLLLKLKRQKKIKRSEYLDSGLYSIIDQGDNLIGGYTNDESYLFDGDLPMTIFGDHTRRFKYIDFPFAIGTDGTQLLVPKKEMDRRFFYYALNNASLKNYGYQRHFKYLKDTKISFPADKKTQREISYVLGSYDDLIENNTKRIKILEEMAQAIYMEMFTSQASKKWEIVALRDVIESYTGGGWGKEEPDENYSGPAYVIRGTDIPRATNGDISICPLRYHTLSNLRARVLQDGDLVFEVSGGSKGQPVGRSLLITNKLLGQFKQNVICASFCKLIRPNQNKISPLQLYEQVLSWYTNGVIEKYQVQSTGISNFKFESFIDEEKITLPQEKVREKFDHLVSPLFDEIYSLGSQNQNLCQARDLLLPKLVTGEIQI
ncbi:MAG: restriction endonuclease subunit S [Patescibacteria group bacterium]